MTTKLKNYTSTVPASKSISKIEEILVDLGARHIAKSYENGGELTGFVFQIEQDDQFLSFKLPANVKAVKEMFLEGVKRPRKGTEKRLTEQAVRAAWKLLLDWTQVQASMIKIGRRSVTQVFLADMYDFNSDKTLYQVMEGRGFKMLGSGK